MWRLHCLLFYGNASECNGWTAICISSIFPSGHVPSAHVFYPLAHTFLCVSAPRLDEIAALPRACILPLFTNATSFYGRAMFLSRQTRRIYNNIISIVWGNYETAWSLVSVCVCNKYIMHIIWEQRTEERPQERRVARYLKFIVSFMHTAYIYVYIPIVVYVNDSLCCWKISVTAWNWLGLKMKLFPLRVNSSHCIILYRGVERLRILRRHPT